MESGFAEDINLRKGSFAEISLLEWRRLLNIRI
jgi:hypothetical protein